MLGYLRMSGVRGGCWRKGGRVFVRGNCMNKIIRKSCFYKFSLKKTKQKSDIFQLILSIAGAWSKTERTLEMATAALRSTTCVVIHLFSRCVRDEDDRGRRRWRCPGGVGRPMQWGWVAADKGSEPREECVWEMKGLPSGFAKPLEVGRARMYLTFWVISSLDQDRVDGNEGSDEEVVTSGPLCV